MSSTIWRRVEHKLTAHHLRDMIRRKLKRASTGLLVCDCGWSPRWFRASWRARLRHLVCGLRGHEWGGVDDVHVGPVGFEESEDTLLYRYRQCDRCYVVDTGAE